MWSQSRFSPLHEAFQNQVTGTPTAAVGTPTTAIVTPTTAVGIPSGSVSGPSSTDVIVEPPSREFIDALPITKTLASIGDHFLETCRLNPSATCIRLAQFLETTRVMLNNVRNGNNTLEELYSAMPTQNELDTFLINLRNGQLMDFQIQESSGSTGLSKIVFVKSPSSNILPPPTREGVPPGGITMATLTNLIRRIDAESIRVCGNATTATEKAKCNQLALIKFDLQEIVRKIEKEQMTLGEVPFTAIEANSFLMNLDKGIVGNLTKPTAPPTAASIVSGKVPGTGSNLQDLFSEVENMKWSMQMTHDPTFSQQSELLDRLEKLEDRIMSYMVTDTKLPEEVKALFEKELQLIANMLNQYAGRGSSDPGAARCPPIQSSRTACGPSSAQHSSRLHSTSSCTGDYSDSGCPVDDGSGVSSATDRRGTQQWSRCFFDGVPRTNPDVYMRPGYEANDNHIKSRASRAAFDESLVGGLDYKERALALCRQVKNADLGDPANFGCISNPAEVSASYSWKGNFKMVCSRLGNTWGGFYPEMLGCLPEDPQQKYSGAMM